MNTTTDWSLCWTLSLPVLSSCVRLTIYHIHIVGVRIEGGGGSGAGFQLFCDDALLLSAGGGGGGGVEGRLVDQADDYSLGGGGGGGTYVRMCVTAKKMRHWRVLLISELMMHVVNDAYIQGRNFDYPMLQ